MGRFALRVIWNTRSRSRLWRDALGLAAITLVASSACGVKPPKQANEEEVGSEGAPPPSHTGEPRANVGDDAPATQGDALPPTKDDRIADDYELTNRDCAELGTQFGQVIRNDELSKLSPKLKDKQRQAAQESIEKAANARAQQWTESCQKSLVGMVQDRKNLKCAMDAKSVKDFDACLNASGGTPPPKK